MEARLQKWGNSNVIRIPKPILKSLNLNTNDIVDIIVDNKKIIIYKPDDSYLSLKERVIEYNKLPEEEKGIVHPIEWGEDVVLEKWD